MDELTIEGKQYISSKRAAKVSGYAKDYIGQLCREGRVDSKLVGRSWYVYEPSIREHRFNDERSKAKKKDLIEEAPSSREEKPTPEANPIDQSWEAPAYTPEPIEELPPLVPTEKEASEDPKTLSEMQSAWQEWFAVRGEEKVTLRAVEPPAEVVYKHEERAEPETSSAVVPVRMIVSDIEPRRENYEEPKRIPMEKEPERVHQSQRRERRSAHGSLIVKSAIGALVVIFVSIAIVATGLIDSLHIGGVSSSPFLQYFQGNSIVEK